MDSEDRADDDGASEPENGDDGELARKICAKAPDQPERNREEGDFDDDVESCDCLPCGELSQSQHKDGSCLYRHGEPTWFVHWLPSSFHGSAVVQRTASAMKAAKPHITDAASTA